MRSFLVFVVMVARAAFAFGIDVNPPPYQADVTTAAMSLFLSPGGNDANACNAVDAGCLTLNGLDAKLPTVIAHAVTITAEAMTSTETVALTRHQFVGPGSITFNAAAMTPFAPATGGADGGITSVAGTANADTTLVLEDSAQAWTTNDLKGRHIQFLTGTAGNIGQRYVITSNTATTVTLAGATTALPVAGDTYVIVTPSTVFIGPFRAFATQVGPVAASYTAPAITFNRVGITGNLVVGGNGPLIQFIEGRVSASASNAAAVNGGRAVFSKSVLISSAQGALNATDAVALTFTGSLFSSNWSSTSSSAGGVVHIFGGINTSLTMSAWTAENTSTSGFVMRLATGLVAPIANPASGQARLVCGGTSSSYGLYGLNSIANSVSSQFPVAGFANLRVEGCATGVSLWGKISLGAWNFAAISNTVGVELRRGAEMDVDTPTFTGNGTDITLDGTGSTIAAIQALSPKLLNSGLLVGHSQFRTNN